MQNLKGQKDLRDLKVAFVHDWLVTYGGAERVLEAMLNQFPDAEIFSLYDFLDEDNRSFIKNKPVKTSFLQKFPFARKHYRNYLPLMPLAIEQFDLSAYDLVISRGVITGPDQHHICMCYSPMRYAWDLTHQYLKEANLQTGLKSWAAKYMLHKLRMWDYRTANGVDNFIAISEFIARRIKKVYGRESIVIYPPVDISAFTLTTEKEDYYLTASRMVPYKKIDLIVKSFKNMPDKKLIVIGDGPEFKKISKKAPPNVTLMGYQPFKVLREKMQRAKAFIFAAEEDFGIVLLEAQACGTPVIAYGKGGALETIVDNETGIFFKEQTTESLCDAIIKFETMTSEFDVKKIRANAERFSTVRFAKEFKEFVIQSLSGSSKNLAKSSRRLNLKKVLEESVVDKTE